MGVELFHSVLSRKALLTRPTARAIATTNHRAAIPSAQRASNSMAWMPGPTPARDAEAEFGATRKEKNGSSATARKTAAQMRKRVPAEVRGASFRHIQIIAVSKTPCQ